MRHLKQKQEFFKDESLDFLDENSFHHYWEGMVNKLQNVSDITNFELNVCRMFFDLNSTRMKLFEN